MSTAMRHVKKNQRVSLAAVHDACCASGVYLEKIDTEIKVSDVFTKGLETVRFQTLRALLGVYDKQLAPKVPSSVLKDLSSEVVDRASVDATRSEPVLRQLGSS